MKSFYFLAVFLALGLANRIHFLYLRGRLLAFFLPQSLLLSVCSQHLLLIRIWRGCLSPVCSVLYRANPLHPARDSGETLPTTSASAFFPPSICTSYHLASWFSMLVSVPGGQLIPQNGLSLELAPDSAIWKV